MTDIREMTGVRELEPVEMESVEGGSGDGCFVGGPRVYYPFPGGVSYLPSDPC
jgi:hypothetical protein